MTPNNMSKYIENRYKAQSRLQPDSTFVFKGSYCIVKRMLQDYFEYVVQETQRVRLMTYKFYLSTPSAAGKRINITRYCPKHEVTYYIEEGCSQCLESSNK